MKSYELKLSDNKTVACKSIGVVEGMKLQGRASSVLMAGFEAAIGKDLSSVFVKGLGPTLFERDAAEPKLGAGLTDKQLGMDVVIKFISGLVKFRLGVDWQEFTDLVIDVCQACRVITKEDGKVYEEALFIDDLDFYSNEQYKVAAWYLECQLGESIGWNRLRPILSDSISQLVAGLNKDNLAPSEGAQ